MKKDFELLMGTFKNSIKVWSYFVNWDKVYSNTKNVEISLNKLNYLLGKDNLKEEFKLLYKSNPDIVVALPILLAVRDKKLEIYDRESRKTELFDFEAHGDAEKYYSFIEETGLISLFKNDGVKNLVDYVLGVEVGLDSNGRKNRGGTLMEEIVESFVKEFCVNKGFEYISQATASEMRKRWNMEIKVNKSERRFDFAIYNPVNKKIKLVETNFYNGGGSKLKAVCGEFATLYDELKRQNIDLIWVTDGLGWKTAKKPLEETYNHNDYVFNLKMLEENVLNNLVW